MHRILVTHLAVRIRCRLTRDASRSTPSPSRRASIAGRLPSTDTRSAAGPRTIGPRSPCVQSASAAVNRNPRLLRNAGTLGRAGLADRDRLAAFHAVLGFVVGAAQAELAGPLTRGRDVADASDRIGSVAGARYPHIEALSKVAMRMSVEEDFDRGLRMLLDGIATRRSRRRR